jgi:hypothetical protein
MKINSFTPFVPANVSIDLNGQSCEIFTLVCLSPFTVLVPNKDQYDLVKDQFDTYVELLKQHISRPLGIKMPEVPEDVLKQAEAANCDMGRRCDHFKQFRTNVERRGNDGG